MSLEHSAARNRKAANIAVNDQSYTVDEFCAAERMSRSMLYKAWAEGWGPEFYWVGVTRRVTHARALSGSASAKRRPQRGRRKNDLANAAVHQPR